MKIMIVGSTVFVKEMVSTREKLMDMGHEVILHDQYVKLGFGKSATITYGGKSVAMDSPEFLDQIGESEIAKIKIENNFMKNHYKEILESDAILVLNFDKNGIKNYVGGNTLIEMGQAYVNDKKIFLLNPIPEVSYRAEIKAMEPIILNGSLDNIKN